jgi:hypothetical protein
MARGISRRRLGLLWGAVTAAIAWLALGGLLVILIGGSRARGDGVLAALGIYLSYFTTISNLMVAIGLTCRLLAPRARGGRFFARPSITAATAVYIATVAIVYTVMLRNLWHPQGWLNVVDHLLHDVVPVLYLVHWALMTPKGHLRWTRAIVWLAFPLGYLVCVLVRGAGLGRYPYAFLDVGQLGPAGVLASVGVLTLLFLAVGLLVIAIDRRLARAATS